MSIRRAWVIRCDHPGGCTRDAVAQVHAWAEARDLAARSGWVHLPDPRDGRRRIDLCAWHAPDVETDGPE